jgi:hypothetical protein
VILIGGLSIGTVNKVNAQGFGFRYYNPIDDTFTIEDWKYKDLVKNAMQNIYTNLELEKYKQINSRNAMSISNLNSEVSLYKAKAAFYQKENDLLYLKNQIQKQLFEESIKLNSSADLVIAGLKTELKREKIKRKWYEISGGLGLAAIFTYTIIQLTK